MKKPLNIELIEIDKLDFDRENPRLPSELHGAEAPELAQYYYDKAVIADLVDSMITSGFYPHEPIIVMPDGNRYKVVEGNRRLTALMIIHNRPEAEHIPKPNPPPTPAEIVRLDKIPCVVSDDLPTIRRFIGYRHISGPRTWDPEAKARFIEAEVDEAAEKENEPFTFVAKRVGTNTQSVRQSYAALQLLNYARDEADFDTSQTQSQRFGVWLRLMSSPEFRKYINFELLKDYQELKDSIQQVDTVKLIEVLKDLRGTKMDPPTLADSRDATAYGRVLMSPIARRTLRKTKDLKAAITIISNELLPERIDKETRRIEALASELQETDTNQEINYAAERLFKAARALAKLSKPDEDGD